MLRRLIFSMNWSISNINLHIAYCEKLRSLFEELEGGVLHLRGTQALKICAKTKLELYIVWVLRRKLYIDAPTRFGSNGKSKLELEWSLIYDLPELISGVLSVFSRVSYPSVRLPIFYRTLHNALYVIICKATV